MTIKQWGRYVLDVYDDNRKRPLITSGSISYANWCGIDPVQKWMTVFVRHSFPQFSWENKAKAPLVRFYSVFGPKKTIRENFDGTKVFFSGENLEEFQRYSRVTIREISDHVWHVRKKKFDHYGCGEACLGLGFPYEDELQTLLSGRCDVGGAAYQYLRFPLWIPYFFNPEANGVEDIQKTVDAINNSFRSLSPLKKTTGIACIASHDFYGTRAGICDVLENNGISIQYAGKWRNNSRVLQDQYRDDKLSYLKSMRFNICPENTDSFGYVTEKLFDAFRAAAIPIYHGSLNEPEKEMIHSGSVIFWNYEENNEDAVEQIKELMFDDAAYCEFVSQPKLTQKCAPYVWERMQLLRNALAQCWNL